MRVHKQGDEVRLEISNCRQIAALVLASRKSTVFNPLSLTTLKEITQMAKWLASSDFVAQMVQQHK